MSIVINGFYPACEKEIEYYFHCGEEEIQCPHCYICLKVNKDFLYDTHKNLNPYYMLPYKQKIYISYSLVN